MVFYSMLIFSYPSGEMPVHVTTHNIKKNLTNAHFKITKGINIDQLSYNQLPISNKVILFDKLIP